MEKEDLCRSLKFAWREAPFVEGPLRKDPHGNQGMSKEPEQIRRDLAAHLPVMEEEARRGHRHASDRDDLVQDCCLQILRKDRHFDGSRPLGPWVRRLSQRVVLGALRKRARSHETSLDDALKGPVAAGSESDVADRLWLEQALPTLTEHQRMVLNLRFYEGLSNADIARALGVSRAAVTQLIDRSIAQLRRRACKEGLLVGVFPWLRGQWPWLFGALAAGGLVMWIGGFDLVSTPGPELPPAVPKRPPTQAALTWLQTLEHPGGRRPFEGLTHEELLIRTGLVLDRTNVDDEGLKHLAAFPRLQTLNLSYTALTDRGLASVMQHPTLHTLTVKVRPAQADLSRLRGGFLKAGAGNQALRCLRLELPDLAPGALKALEALPKLQTLVLCGEHLTPASLEDLGPLPGLAHVEILSGNITEEALRPYARWQGLQSCRLNRKPIPRP